MIDATVNDTHAATLHKLDGTKRLELVCSAPLSPGQPLSISVERPAIQVTGKTIASKKRDDGRYNITMRIHVLRKEHRALLLDALSTTP